MTDLAAADLSNGASSRLSLPLRLVLLAIAFIVLLFGIGLIFGIGLASLERGTLAPRESLFLAATSLVAALSGWLCWRLAAPWRRPGRSAYERRYARMMLVLVCAGLPVGLLLGIAGDGRTDDLVFSNGPLDARFAAIAAVSLVVVLAGTLVHYHRTIDDHEQQAYLWANSIAFYFVALALPAAWLLARGGLIPPIGIGTALLILLAAFVINFGIWLWLKFR